MSEFWGVIDDQLADLNRQATMTLEALPPAPDGLPPAGTWIRAMRLDDDSQAVPESPWHGVAGWNGVTGNVMLLCARTRPGTAIRLAVMGYLGERPAWGRGLRFERIRLFVELDRPVKGVCQKCAVRLARDVSAAARDRLEAEQAQLVALLPTIGAFATDPTIDDAERGRRLRESWPA